MNTMQNSRTIGRGLVAAAMLGASSMTALAADSYTATPIPPVDGGTGTVGYGVNDSGVVVGQADLGSVLVAFVYMNGVSTALPLLPGGSDAKAWSVNANNVVVGECRDGNNITRPVKWEFDGVNGWTVTDLGTLASGNAGFGVATRINDVGQIVGYSTAAIPGGYHATVWDGGTKVDAGTLGFSGNLAYSQGLGINNLGAVTGFAYAVLAGPEHGLYYAPPARAEDVTPEGRFGLAQWHNVNDFGVLAGYVSEPTLTSGMQPATYIGGSGITLIPLLDGLPEGYGYDINNDGTVVGAMFLLAPVPDPNIFTAFKYEGGATVDLNAVTTGLPGLMTEARDVANAGLIVGTSDIGGNAQAVLLTPVTPCPADFNGQGGVSVQDIFDFLSAWFTVSPTADINGDRNVTVQDIFDFLAHWFGGC